MPATTTEAGAWVAVIPGIGWLGLVGWWLVCRFFDEHRRKAPPRSWAPEARRLIAALALGPVCLGLFALALKLLEAVAALRRAF